MYYAIAGFLFLAIAAFLFLRDSTPGGPGTPPVDIETPEKYAARIRQGYYDDLFSRGDQWEEAAAEFLSRTENMTDTEEIYSIYHEIYDNYAGQPTPSEYKEYTCPVDGKSIKGLAAFQQHVKTHALPTLQQIKSEMNYLTISGWIDVLKAYSRAEYPGITQSEWETLWVQSHRRNLYMVLYYKTDESSPYTSWRPRANDFWQRTEGMASYSDIYASYLAVLALGPKPLPTPESATIDEQMASIIDALGSGSVHPVWVLRDGIWLYWDPNDPGSDLTEIKAGEAASINVTRDVTLSYNGHTYQLKTGWNNIGWLG